MRRALAAAAFIAAAGCADPYVHRRTVPLDHGDDYYPIKVVAPEYPAQARLDGVEGFVTLELDVTETGIVENVRVVESDPPGVFDETATHAVLQYEYKPRVENGVPVRATGVRTTLSFTIEERR